MSEFQVYHLFGFAFGMLIPPFFFWLIKLYIPERCRLYRNKHWYLDENSGWIKRHHFWRCTCQVTIPVTKENGGN